jgi:hypothetical protein
MRGKGTGHALMWSTIAASCAASAAAFLILCCLREDPLPSLGATFWIAAFLQAIPAGPRGHP